MIQVWKVHIRGSSTDATHALKLPHTHGNEIAKDLVAGLMLQSCDGAVSLRGVVGNRSAGEVQALLFEHAHLGDLFSWIIAGRTYTALLRVLLSLTLGVLRV
jgi:hypothetical protein